MVEVAVTVEVEDAMSTDEAERYVRDCINSEPGLRVKYLSWATASAPKRPEGQRA